MSGRPARARRPPGDYWDLRYGEDPALFGSQPSRFARWAAAILGSRPPRRRLVELGCGYARDVRFFAARGFRVMAGDASRDAVQLARANLRGLPADAPRAVVHQCDALPFLRRLTSGSVDAVFSNLFWNLDFTVPQHIAHFREIRRVLRPGGSHLYSVRSVEDPWYGRGRRVGPATYDLSPHGTVMHFFSAGYARRLDRGAGMRTITIRPQREGGRQFPIAVLYVHATRAADVPAGRRSLPSKSRRLSPTLSGRSRASPAAG